MKKTTHLTLMALISLSLASNTQKSNASTVVGGFIAAEIASEVLTRVVFPIAEPLVLGGLEDLKEGVIDSVNYITHLGDSSSDSESETESQNPSQKPELLRLLPPPERLLLLPPPERLLLLPPAEVETSSTSRRLSFDTAEDFFLDPDTAAEAQKIDAEDHT